MTTRVENLLIILFKTKCFEQITLFSRTKQGAATKKKCEKIFCFVYYEKLKRDPKGENVCC